MTPNTPASGQAHPDARERVRSAVTHPSYRLAEADPDFVGGQDLRAVRLELDYLKTEHGLAAHEIAHTVVVFGSTRIPEPAAAQRALDAARQARDAAPQDADLQAAHALAERIAVNSRYYVIARAFARRIAEAGDGQNGDKIAIMTGGGPGLMEAANRGAMDLSSQSVGLNIALPQEQAPNPYLTEGLCFQLHYFAMRKLHFLLRARALVAFPGGFGTFDELFETLVLVQTRKIAPLPILLVGRDFWSRAVDFGFLQEQGVISRGDRALFSFVETADEAFDHIANWYRNLGTPLFG
ncbi:LOG family protein [Salipiger sp. 1_MG-2023]|uniref:LOG family protein n=1 Tax=Salipiger sp. 1_MG-2023 TaxID=3062665 RepID=UPI0026E328DA|nr:LOG family protein [Salipiger sp. 1_MG-2023]MDO6586551.1 LOG family protein [Salipiger sp. 1_MG-2023]